jgi:hypothetical protein
MHAIPVTGVMSHLSNINPLNAKLNHICHLLASLEAHHILRVSRIRVNNVTPYLNMAAIHGVQAIFKFPILGIFSN